MPSQYSITRKTTCSIWGKKHMNGNKQACGKYMPATAATVQSNQIGTASLQDGTYLVEESF